MSNLDDLSIDVALEVEKDDPKIAIDFLLDNINLSKSRLKDTMNKGAVWLVRGDERQRLRRAMTDLKLGDQVEIYYDHHYLSAKGHQARLLDDKEHYSVWFKPSGMLVEGIDWGDHQAFYRQLDLALKGRESFYLQELVTEEAGLIILAHNRKTAARLNDLLEQGKFVAQLRLEIAGEMEELADFEEDCQLKVLKNIGIRNIQRSKLLVSQHHLETDTLRAWLKRAGHPVVGEEDVQEIDEAIYIPEIKLNLSQLEFPCPLTGEPQTYSAY